MADVSINVLVEGSSGTATAVFTDRNGDSLTPKTLKWTLTDIAGTVINSREDVDVAAPAASTEILLSGDDLQIRSGETLDAVKHPKGLFSEAITKYYAKRILTFKATYDSDLGSDLPLNGSILFPVEQLPAVADQ